MGGGHLGPQGSNLNNLGRGLLNKATNQFGNLRPNTFQKEDFS